MLYGRRLRTIDGMDKVRRGAGWFVACSAGLGGGLIVVVCLPGLLLSGLAIAAILAVVAAVVRPKLVWTIAVTAAAIVATWLAGDDGWLVVDGTVGLTSRIVVGLEAVAVLGVAWAYLRWSSWIVVVTIPVVLASTIGVVASSNGFTGLRQGITYCGRESLDLYRPAGDRPAPVVVYVHGGGFLLGNRTIHGPWASAHADALFGPVRDRLAAHGIAVASIDYRLLPGSDWRAPIEDVKCAVRYLRADAARLRLDPNHIGAWGSSAGGTLVSLLALAPGFDTPPYAGQSSRVQAVVNMFGPADLTRLGDSGGFARVVADLALGTRPDVRRALSPINYVTASAPPFLILHGDQDKEIPLALSQELATRLQDAGVPATFVTVHGTGHSLSTPTEQPSPDRLADQVADFLERTLA